MTKEKFPDYRDYMTHRKAFWKQKMEEEERLVRRLVRLYGKEN